MSDVTSFENALLVIFKFSARPWNSLRSIFVWAVKLVRLDCKLKNVAFGGVTILLDLHTWISLKILRNKCVKVVLRARWLVTVEGSWETVGDSSLVQCETRFVQIFHIFFFMKPLILYPDLTLSYAVGDLGTRLPLFLLTHSLNYLWIPFVLSQ